VRTKPALSHAQRAFESRPASNNETRAALGNNETRAAGRQRRLRRLFF
jgi:hypothetical protein